MRAVLLACGLAAVGCSGGSKAPSFAKPVDDGGGTAPSGPTVTVSAARPEQSDPAAEARVGELLLKHTASEPGRVDRLKTYICRRKGSISTGAGPLDVAMSIRGVWPGFQRAEFAVATPAGPANEVFGLRNGAVWNAKFASLKDATATPIDPDKYEEARADLWAEWVLTLLPLTAPDRRVGPAPDDDGFPAVRLWAGDRPAVLLTIDSKTGLLARVRYEVKSAGRLVVRTLHLSEYKEVAGVQLPHRVSYTEGAATGTLYKSVEYELPASIDPAVFEKP